MSNTVLKDVYLHALYETAFSSIIDYLPEETTNLVEIGAGDGISRTFLPKSFLTDIQFRDFLH